MPSLGCVTIQIIEYHCTEYLHLHLVFLLPPGIFLQDHEAFQDVAERDELLRRKFRPLGRHQPHRSLMRLEPGDRSWFPRLPHNVESLERLSMIQRAQRRNSLFTCPMRTVTGLLFSSSSRVIKKLGNMAVTRKYSIQRYLSSTTRHPSKSVHERP